MRKEQKIMMHIESMQIFDATKYLGCSTCPMHNNCIKYSLICDLIHDKLFLGANLLCCLMRAENTAMNTLRERVKNKLTNPSECAKTSYKDFLPALNNHLNAFYKYECEQSDEYAKCAIIFALAESLEYWDLLEYFDFMFKQDIEDTRTALKKQYEPEILKSEKEKLAANKKR